MDAKKLVLSVLRTKRPLKRGMALDSVLCASSAMLFCVSICALHVTMQRTDNLFGSHKIFVFLPGLMTFQNLILKLD